VDSTVMKMEESLQVERARLEAEIDFLQQQYTLTKHPTIPRKIEIVMEKLSEMTKRQ